MALASLLRKTAHFLYFLHPSSATATEGTARPRGINKLLILMANKADIVDKVHSVLGSTKADAERAVESVIETIVKSLKSGEEVSIAGLGIFATKARPAREGRNPRTGETIRIAASRTAKFRPAKALKDAVK